MVVVWHLPETKIIKANNYTSYYCITKTDKAPHVVVWVKVKQIWVLYLTYSTWDFSSFLLISREGLKCYVTCSKIQVSLIVQYVAFLHLWFHWLYTCKMVQFLPQEYFFFFLFSSLKRWASNWQQGSTHTICLSSLNSVSKAQV